MSQAVGAIDPAWVKLVTKLVDRAGIMDEEFAAELGAALIRLPRSMFFDSKLESSALKDCALSVGYDKFELPLTVVIRMLGLLAPRKGERVLVAGCGAGYVPALCISLGAQTYVVETNGLLAQRTRKRLDALGFQNALIRTGSALSGWNEYAPFDQIFVSSAVSAYPTLLSRQLNSEGGKLICMVGAHPDSTFELGERFDTELKTYRLEPVKLT